MLVSLPRFMGEHRCAAQLLRWKRMNNAADSRIRELYMTSNAVSNTNVVGDDTQPRQSSQICRTVSVS